MVEYDTQTGLIAEIKRSTVPFETFYLFFITPLVN